MSPPFEIPNPSMEETVVLRSDKHLLILSSSCLSLGLGQGIALFLLSSTTNKTHDVNPTSITDGLIAVTSQAGVDADINVT